MATKNTKTTATATHKLRPTTKSPGKSAIKPEQRPRTAAKQAAAKRQRPAHIIHLINDTMWLLSLMVMLYVALSLASFTMDDPAWSRSVPPTPDPHNLGGLFGAYLADVCYYLFGLSAWWLVVAAAVWLFKNFRPLRTENSKVYNHLIAGLGLLVLLIFSPIMEVLTFQTQLANQLPVGAGGLIGSFAASGLIHLLGTSGSLLIMLVVLLLALSLLTQISWLDVVEKAGTKLEWWWMKLMRKSHHFITELPDAKTTRRMVREAKNITAEPIEKLEGSSSNRKAVAVAITTPAPIQKALFDEHGKAAPIEAGEYQLPALNLLRRPQGEIPTVDPDVLQQTAERIEAKLAEFGIEVQVVSATAGPVITRFEIEPAQGVKGSQIVNLNKDLARSLSLQSVRVVETIAGKTSMGIELPNERRQDVMLREVFAAQVFNDAVSKLTVAIGKDIAGLPVVADLAKMPHLLIAGTTGSGKSVGVNAMILSMLYKATPEEVRFIMIDPKMLELSVYEGIPHLLCPVVTDMKEAGQALTWCVAEMEKRYRLLSHAGVRNIDNFNEKVLAAQDAGEPLMNPFSLNPDDPEPLHKLPFIVVVIDELADLMMVEGKKVEQQIARLAQKARAAGIHLILATQRPSVDVITGLIKANVPTRISFQVKSKIDSRTILDQMGAEALLGKGDMLFLPPGNAEPTRLHGAFVSDDEVHQIVSYIKRQAPSNYVEGLLSGEAALETVNAVSPNAHSDELFDQAVAFVIESRKTSISSLQRQLRIGYNRAANLMQALEDAGVVSPADVGGSRRILAQKDQLG